MTISEVISKLGFLRMKHGDIDVFVNDYEIIKISYDEEDKVIQIEG